MWMRRLALAILTLTLFSCGNQPGLSPDRIYLNGSVITMDSNQRLVEAVAIFQGKIAALGSSRQIGSLAGPRTEVVDLAGQVVVPGFYAPHDHFPGAGTSALFSVDLNSPPIGKIEDLDGLITALKAAAAKTPAGKWIRGRGYDDTLLKEQRHPTRHDLDLVSTKHPIYIAHTSGHLGVANSLALRQAGITRDTPQPAGGVIQRDPQTGEPNGVFEESGGLVSRLIPPLSQQQRLEAIEWAGKHYVSRGVTTAVITGMSGSRFSDLQKARASGILPLRIVAMGRKGNPGQASASEAAGLLSGFGDEWLKLGGVKIVQDGSNQGYTGYFTKPYHSPFKADPDYRGYPRRSREDLSQMVKKLHEAGYQIAIHGNGDAAIDDILYAFGEAQKNFPRVDARHRIEHCQMVREDQLDVIQRLGISPSFFVGHVYYWGDRHRDIFMGPERAARISPLQSAIDREVRFTVHDDTPVTPVNPIQLIWVSVNRLTKSNQVLGAAQRITPLQALRSITIDAAWQNFEEKIKGSIEPGKLADLVILDQNPLTVDPSEIRNIQVLATVVGGETVFQR